MFNPSNPLKIQYIGLEIDASSDMRWRSSENCEVVFLHQLPLLGDVADALVIQSEDQNLVLEFLKRARTAQVTRFTPIFLRNEASPPWRV